MAQRNPMNQRYTGDKPTGKTRKSAASAKPARKAADSVRMKSSSAPKSGGLFGASKSPEQKEQEKQKRIEGQNQRDLVMTVGGILMERNPLYKKLRRLWWIILIIAIVATLSSWAIQFQFPDMPQQVSIVVLVIAYLAIIATLVLDLVKIRPIRNASRKEAAGMSKKQQERLVYDERIKLDEKKAARLAKKGRSTAKNAEESPDIAGDGNASEKKENE